MNRNALHVIRGEVNNGVYTLMTPGFARTMAAVHELVQSGTLTWDDVWKTFTHEGVDGIATFSDAEIDGLTGTLADMQAIFDDLRLSDGQVETFQYGNFVPHSNQVAREKPSVNLNTFRHLIGLQPTKVPTMV